MRPNVPERSSSNDSNPLQREARIHSIYDKYLYDPKDLNSSDPRIRQLARQASLAHQHQHKHTHTYSSDLVPKQPLSIIQDDEESNRTMSTASSSAPLVKRAAFSEGTKANDAPSGGGGGGHKRDESAGGVWAGFITGGVASDDESDSDDDDAIRQRQPTTPASAAPPSPATPSRASWTSRAAAVGSRPPDSASQNPLSLKLLGLKSLKDGGTPIGSRSPNASSSTNERSFDIVQYAPASAKPSRFEADRSRDEEARRMRDVDEEIHRSRVQSQSDYGDAADELDRHGSTINFGGGGAGGLSALDEYMNDRARDSRGVQLDDAPRVVSPPNAPISVTRAPPEPMRSPEVPEQRGGLTTHAANAGGAAGRPVSPRTALTRQLGLGGGTPSPLPDTARNGERGDYFGAASLASSSPTRPQAAGTPPFQYASSNGHSPAPSSQPPNSASPPRGGKSLPPSSLRGPPPPAHDADPFGGGPGVPLQRGPPPDANGMMPNGGAAPQPVQRGSPSPPQGARGAPPPSALRAGGPQPPPNAMQRGQAPQYGGGGPPPAQQQQQRGMLPGFSNVPPPRSPALNGAPLPSPRGPPPPPQGPNGFRGPPPPGKGGLHPNGPPSGGAGPFPRGAPPPGPGFSDARRAQQGPPGQRRSNVFRRSMAFMTGQGGGQQQQQGPGPQQRGGPAGPQQRRSMLRRSMAFFTGRNAPPPPAAAAPDEDDDANAPQPRVRGFVDDEKPVRRQSQYLGAGGMGDEWDVSGAGSKFWRRFSQAQRAAQKPDPVSQRWVAKALSGRKRVNCLAALGLLCIVGAIVGIILWRESKNKASDTPGSINRADFGGTNAAGTIVAQPTTQPVGVAGGGAATDGADDVATSTPRARATRTRTRRRTQTLDDRALAPTPPMLTTLAPRTPAEVVQGIQDSILAARQGGPHPLPRRRSGSVRRRLDWQGEQTLHRRAAEHLVRKETDEEEA